MTINKTIWKATAILFVVFSFTACENDFDSIGSDIIGEPGFNAELYDEAGVSATNVKLEAVQTNLPQNSPPLLGVYTDEVYGTQVASVLTQLSLLNQNPLFGNQPEMDSVVLSIPYYSSQGEPNEDGIAEYELDSVYGDGPIKLSVYHSNLFLNSFDPQSNFQDAQKYYSDMQQQIENNLVGDALFETDNFIPSAEEVEVYGRDELGEADTVVLPPTMRLKLSNKFFQEKILDKEGSAELSSNNSFQNYLRGLYVKAEAVNGDGTSMLLNFRDPDAGIILYFTSKIVDETDSDDDGDNEELIDRHDSYEIKFGGNIINTFDQDQPEFEEGNIYLKGGAGSMAVIELFTGSDELEYLRENDWLINEASLTFYVDQEDLGESMEPERLYLYDLENNRMLADYSFDVIGELNQLTSGSNISHSRPLVRDENGNGINYRLRITEHVRRILNEDAENVKLGLVVTQNINLVSTLAVREASSEAVNKIPTSSVITPLGTVLHGPNSADEEKRLKLNIYYTEPKD